MTFFQLHIGLPRVTQEGEIRNSSTRLGSEIGSGRHGTAHEGILNDERVCFKRYHSSWSHLFTTNPAKHEFGRLVQARTKLPELADSLQSPIGWCRDRIVGPLLVSHLVQDCDGAPSQPLKYTAEISRSFFRQLEMIFETLATQDVLYNPVAANILVQRTSDTESRPILIDLTNYESYLHYVGKGVTHLVSPASRSRHISKWLEASLNAARRKVVEPRTTTTSLEDLSLPPRVPFSQRPRGN